MDPEPALFENIFWLVFVNFDGITHKYLHCSQHAVFNISLLSSALTKKNIEYVWKGIKTFSDPKNSNAPGHPTPGFWGFEITEFATVECCLGKTSYNYEEGIAEINSW